MRKLEGKSAVITGANRGLGKAIVKCFAEEGCNIWAVVRTETDEYRTFARGIENDNDVRIKIIEADLTSEEQIKYAYKQINADKRSIDILINNAGIGHMGLFQLSRMELIKEVYAVNVYAPMLLTQLVLRNMCKQKSGQIINVASTAATEIYQGNSIYGSSKAALVAFTQSLASETLKYGVTVNAIAPGLIDTEMSSIFEGKEPEEPIRHTALERKIEPNEIAQFLVTILSENTKIMNGTVVTINGGHK